MVECLREVQAWPITCSDREAIIWFRSLSEILKQYQINTECEIKDFAEFAG